MIEGRARAAGVQIQCRFGDPECQVLMMRLGARYGPDPGLCRGRLGETAIELGRGSRAYRGSGRERLIRATMKGRLIWRSLRALDEVHRRIWSFTPGRLVDKGGPLPPAAG